MALDLFKKSTERKTVGHTNIAIYGESGLGKALANSELLLTQNGFIKNGDVKVGDKVIGSSGKPINVTNVFPQGKRPIYNVNFRDGTTLKCDREHRFSVRRRGKKKELITLTVNEMIAEGVTKERKDKRYPDEKYYESRFAIPKTPQCEYGEKCIDDFFIHPYVLGILLGDGGFTTTSISFTNKHEHILDKLEALLPVGIGFNEKKFYGGAYNVIISDSLKGEDNKNRLNTELKRLKLSGLGLKEKFIPEEYKNANLECRQLIIQGLIDTDGYMKDNNLHEYSSSSKLLAYDFLEIGRSIGMSLTINSRIPVYTYNGEKKLGAENYRIHQKFRTNFNYITSIEYSHDEEATCITVDSEDSLYIAGRGFNLTHNTIFVTSHLKNAVILDVENGLASMDGSDETLYIVDIHNSGKEKFSSTNEDGTEYIYSPAEVFALTLATLEKQVIDGTFNYKTLVIDSYSMYSQMLFEAVAGDGKLYHETVSRNHERLMRLPCNTIMIFQDSTVKTEDGYMKKTPSVVGTSFKDAIPYKYDVVLHIKKDGDKIILDEDGTDTTRAKNRLSKKMGEAKFNDFENLQEALDFLDKL